MPQSYQITKQDDKKVPLSHANAITYLKYLTTVGVHVICTLYAADHFLINLPVEINVSRPNSTNNQLNRYNVKIAAELLDWKNIANFSTSYINFYSSKTV